MSSPRGSKALLPLLAGEGGGRSPSDEGSRRLRSCTHKPIKSASERDPKDRNRPIADPWDGLVWRMSEETIYMPLLNEAAATSATRT
jgi:hypothetical protein